MRPQQTTNTQDTHSTGQRMSRHLLSQDTHFTLGNTGAIRRSGGSHGIRFSRIVFTINGTDAQLDFDMTGLKTLTPKWLICGREVCPTTGRRHLQGACVLGKAVPFSVIKKMPGLTRAHIENMKGSPQQSKTYCSKEDKDAYEYGEITQPGKRNDLHAAIDLLRDGCTIQDLVRTADTPIVATFVRYPKGLSSVSQFLREAPTRDIPFVLWLHGSTGTGKTRCAHDIADAMGCSNDIWLSNGSLQWFDGYNGHKLAVLDDYRTNHAKFSFMLRLLDRYRFDVPFKGGFVNWQPLIIIVTTPKSARNTWNLRTEEDIAQLERRVTLSADLDRYEDGYDAMFADVLEKLRGGVRGLPEFDKLRELLGPAMGAHDGGDEPQPELQYRNPDGSRSDSDMGSTSDATDEDLQEQDHMEDSGRSPYSSWSDADVDDASTADASKEKVFF